MFASKPFQAATAGIILYEDAAAAKVPVLVVEEDERHLRIRRVSTVRLRKNVLFF